MIDLLLDRYVYVFVITLLAVGLYGVLARTNLIKKLIGLTIYSTAIYLFFIEGSLKSGATAPVIDERGTDPALYVDPVPHLLILTAIVVGVGVLGVGLALSVRLYRAYGTLDEEEIVARLSRPDPSPGSEPRTSGTFGTAAGKAPTANDRATDTPSPPGPEVDGEGGAA